MILTGDVGEAFDASWLGLEKKVYEFEKPGALKVMLNIQLH